MKELSNGIGEKNTGLYFTPNKNARPASLESFDHSVNFHGYQEYSLSKNWIHVLPTDASLQKKFDLLLPFFQPRFLQNRTLLDLGANAAFYCFWALQQKAQKATAVDIDEEYLLLVKKAKEQLGFENLDIVRENIMDWKEPADVVVALALVHWIYSCTALIGSLDAVVEKLAGLTKYMLIVEWIEPEDAAIQFFHHLDWNKDIAYEPYTREVFYTALTRHFKRVVEIGPVSPTRKLYAAFLPAKEIDLSAPFPLVKPYETILSGHILTVVDGIEYWSYVYDTENSIFKQATLNLASREADFLRELNSDYFPKVLNSWSEGTYSVIQLEKIDGDVLDNAANKIDTLDAMYAFIIDCLNILRELSEKGIVHRDIRPDNILVRNGRPVLLDFGWAQSQKYEFVTPDALGGVERPLDGNFSDVYSMGKVIERVTRGKQPDFLSVINLMTAPVNYLRVEDLDLLYLFFDLTFEKLKGSK